MKLKILVHGILPPGPPWKREESEVELFRRQIKIFVFILFDFTSSNASYKFSLLYSNIHAIVNVEVSSQAELRVLRSTTICNINFTLFFFFISGKKWDVATRIFVSNPMQSRTHSLVLIQFSNDPMAVVNAF